MKKIVGIIGGLVIILAVLITKMGLSWSGKSETETKDKDNGIELVPETKEYFIKGIVKEVNKEYNIKLEIISEGSKFNVGQEVQLEYEKAFLGTLNVEVSPNVGDEVATSVKNIENSIDGKTYLYAEELIVNTDLLMYEGCVIKEIIDKDSIKVNFVSGDYVGKDAIIKYSEYELQGNYDNGYKATIGEPKIGDEVVLFSKEKINVEGGTIEMKCDRVVRK